MGRAFDHDRGGMIPWVNWLSEIMSESLRVMKPGAIGLVWSIPRTCGWTQLALELAGFKIIDSIVILSGSGFPKGADISKHIDKLHNRDREVIGTVIYGDGHIQNSAKSIGFGGSDPDVDKRLITAPNHPDAVKWDGWKSAQLKPSHEDWFIVQKPVEGTIARNILKWGVGGVNIEACRIGTDEVKAASVKRNGGIWSSEGANSLRHNGSGTSSPNGRYPANTILVCSPECEGETHARSCPISILGEQGGERKSGGGIKTRVGSIKGTGMTHGKMISTVDIKGLGGDTGTAARYFKQLPHDPETFDTFHYFTKASQKDRSCDGAVKNTHC